eukprot:gene6974-8316_t
MDNKLLDQIFNLKFTAKQLVRQAKKCEKVKKAIEKGNVEVVSRLETQSKMNVINKSMAGIVKSLERALNSNNLEQARVRESSVFCETDSLLDF